MSPYEDIQRLLREQPRRWLVTGAAGFIGSHLVEKLLALGQQVVALDNFATGHRRNIDDVGGASKAFTFLEGDIRDAGACAKACEGADIVLHQAALGSVPRSLDKPRDTHSTNVDGFVNVLLAARDAGVKRFVFASSSSVYGDHPALPKVEDAIGEPLSPYAASKRINEICARVYQDAYKVQTVGLRYFNVFGPRQDPEGPYAAVIPRWVANLLHGEPCRINGDGSTSRDFCYVANVVQANLLAATVGDENATNQVYNVACGAQTTLNELYRIIRDGLAKTETAPLYGEFRAGDVRHSLASIEKARRLLGFEPTHGVAEGMAEALGWYGKPSPRRTPGFPPASPA